MSFGCHVKRKSNNVDMMKNKNDEINDVFTNCLFTIMCLLGKGQ